MMATITHCLGLGHETMVCAVCLSVFLWCIFTVWNNNISTRITKTHKVVLAKGSIYAQLNLVIFHVFFHFICAMCLYVLQWRVDSPHKGPVMLKMLPFDVIVTLVNRDPTWMVNYHWETTNDRCPSLWPSKIFLHLNIDIKPTWLRGCNKPQCILHV